MLTLEDHRLWLVWPDKSVKNLTGTCHHIAGQLGLGFQYWDKLIPRCLEVFFPLILIINRSSHAFPLSPPLSKPVELEYKVIFCENITENR